MRIIDKYCKMNYRSYRDFKERFVINVPERFNFAYDVVDEIAAKSPDKTALVWCNDEGEEHFFSFGDMKTLSDKAANVLKDCGIGRGDRVMLTLKRRYEYWIITLALCKLGATVIPATFLLTEKDFKYRFTAANVRMIITEDDDELCGYIAKAQAATGDILRVKASLREREGFLNFTEALEAASPDFERPTGEDAQENSDVMLMYFTSGTTGMPKMVTHDFTYPLGHIVTAGFWQNLQETDLHFTAADTGWAKCSWGKIYGQWICEAAVFAYDYGTRFKPQDYLHLIEKYKITTFCAPPTIFRFFIKEDLSQFDLSSLRATYIAGEPLNPEVYKQWYQATGLKLREGYGQTETCVLAATFPWLEPKPGSMGKPSPWFNIQLLDRDGRVCEPGEEGEVCVDMRLGRPAGLFIEYYQAEEKTAECKYDGFYHTGDMAWADEDGYLWFIGRNDDVIKSSGYRIGPFEVESAMLEHPAVLETAITAVPDPVRGQVVKATVVLARGYTPSEELKKELQNHVKKATAPYKYPRIVEFVDELPKTSSGKIRRVEIRQRDSK